MLMATPLYVPYLRLAFPCLLATWLGFALAVPELQFGHPGRAQEAGLGWGCGLVACWIGGYVCYQSVQPQDDARALPRDRRGLLRVAREVRARDSGAGGRVIYVYGEPALLFQLRA